MRPLHPALLTVLLFAPACAPPGADTAAHKELVRRFTTATNAGDWAALDTILAEDFTRHSAATAGPPVTSRDAFVQLQQAFLVSFPDQRVEIHQLVAEGDRVAALATYHGTNTGPLPMPTGEVPATGRTVEAPFLALFRIEDGLIRELWVEWDNLAMLGQLGLFPPPDADGP